MNYVKDAESIIEAVGGKANIISVAHCATRLRFVLKEETIVKEKDLEELAIVKGTFSTNGQYQIIIGAGTVNMICAEIQQLLGEDSTSSTKEEPKQKGHLVSRAVKVLSDIFVPIIPAIVAGGLLMGIYNVLSAPFFDGESLIQLYPQIEGLAKMINTFSSAPFAFLPVLIGFSATKKFGGNPFLGAAMGMIMVHPDLLNAYALGTKGAVIPNWNVFQLVIPAVGYQGTVLPILLVSFILASIEKRLHKVTPSWLDNLTTPLISIMVTAFLTFLVIGPVMRLAGDWMSSGIAWLYYSLGFVGGGIFGGFYAPIVITGMHHSFIAVETQLLAASATTGGSFIFVTASMSNVAQGAAVLAVLTITKNEKIKSLCSASGISSLLGISEPAMFGVNLKLRYPFIAACIGSACGSAWIAYTQTLAISLGAAGLPGFISVESNHYVDFAIGLLLAFAITFALTLVLGKRQMKKTEVEYTPVDIDTKQELSVCDIAMVMDGEVKDISACSDPVFAQKTMGDGFLVLPSDGNVYAPSDGMIEFLFPTKHAIGFTTHQGISLLLHCGIDTVQLEGKGFEIFVKEAQVVKQGDLLLHIDIAEIEKAGYRSETMIVFTNLAKDQQVTLKKKGQVTHGERIIELTKS